MYDKVGRHWCQVSGSPLWSSGSWHYLSWRAGSSCRTSSQMWGCWILPRFLLRDGVDPYEHGFLDGAGNAMSLPTHNGKTVHIDTVSRRLTLFVYGGGSLRWSLSLFPKVFPGCPMYSPSQPAWVPLNLQITPLFWVMISLS